MHRGRGPPRASTASLRLTTGLRRRRRECFEDETHPDVRLEVPPEITVYVRRTVVRLHECLRVGEGQAIELSCVPPTGREYACVAG